MGTGYYIVIIVAILGCVGFLFWYRKQQSKSGNRPQQRGIIK